MYVFTLYINQALGEEKISSNPLNLLSPDVPMLHLVTSDCTKSEAFALKRLF